jgi:UDP-N-acetylglucosamine acyltransferase
MLNQIHPTAIISDTVKIGSGNYIGPYSIITGDTEIGDNNYIASHVVIGSPAEHKEYFGKIGKVIIGNNNRINEFVTINQGTVKPTRLHDNIIMLRGSHVGHDSEIFDNVTISCNVMVGGHSSILEYANIGLGAVLHQYSVIGSVSMVGMGSVVIKSSEARPCVTIGGNPARFLKKNIVGMIRANVTNQDLEDLNKRYESLRSHSGI